MKTDWDPQLYLKYKNERTQPSIDLVSRINIDRPENIIDIGCGPGNSTQILSLRWPESNITGLDNSPEMIKKAGIDYPQHKWILADLSEINSDIKYDIVFSNAVIQWVPDHQAVISKLFSLVNENGILAVQVPMFRDMPIGKSIEEVASRTGWRGYTSGCADLFTYHDCNFYYDILTGHSNLINIWVTSYIHILDSHESILEWIRSTGIKPYLDRIEDASLKNNFEKEILHEIKKIYPEQKNGKVLFPFKRLFFTAVR